MGDFKMRFGPAIRDSPVDAFASLDANGDGYTEPYPEFLVATGRMTPPLSVVQSKAMFEALDADHDRKVTAAEFFAAYTAPGYQDATGSGSFEARSEAKQMTFQEYRACLKDERFLKRSQEVDANLDGVLDHNEFFQAMRSCRKEVTLAQAQAAFGGLDADRDGWLSTAEFLARGLTAFVEHQVGQVARLAK